MGRKATIETLRPQLQDSEPNLETGTSNDEQVQPGLFQIETIDAIQNSFAFVCQAGQKTLPLSAQKTKSFGDDPKVDKHHGLQSTGYFRTTAACQVQGNTALLNCCCFVRP